jgi:hypothetical protein
VSTSLRPDASSGLNIQDLREAEVRVAGGHGADGSGCANNNVADVGPGAIETVAASAIVERWTSKIEKSAPEQEREDLPLGLIHPRWQCPYNPDSTARPAPQSETLRAAISSALALEVSL